MADRAKHAFGALERVDESIANGTLDSYDILFVTDSNGKPYVGWVDKQGNKIICDDSAEFAELENQISTKVSDIIKTVDYKIEEKIADMESAIEIVEF